MEHGVMHISKSGHPKDWMSKTIMLLSTPQTLPKNVNGKKVIIDVLLKLNMTCFIIIFFNAAYESNLAIL